MQNGEEFEEDQNGVLASCFGKEDSFESSCTQGDILTATRIANSLIWDDMTTAPKATL